MPEADRARGYLALVLHAHLPFVRHPEHERFLEERWLYEALCESYIPLLQVCERLLAEGVPYRLTLSLSPTLISMLDDDLLRRRFAVYLDDLRRLLASERRRTAGDPRLQQLTAHYGAHLDGVLDRWQRAGGDLVSAFAALQDRGVLDVLTCAATHAYLPLLERQPEAVWAQIAVGVAHYRRRFRRPPSGIWLPECGFFSGLDRLLAAAGLRYFVADTHGVLWAEPQPHAATFAPIFCPDSGVAAFPRDPSSSIEVWCRERGYPGAPEYREFYRDVGFELDEEALRAAGLPPGVRSFTGIKYHRITGPVEHKELYDPVRAQAMARAHAEDFLRKRVEQTRRAGTAGFGRPPLVVSPYDAELFGHWWYEGPLWIEHVLRGAAALAARGVLQSTHLADYLRAHPTHQLARPVQSSWGERGFHEYWLNDRTAWIYPPLHWATEQLVALARDPRRGPPLRRRALRHAARELLLAQASDWAFMITGDTARSYAERRTRSHLGRFAELHRQLCGGAIDRRWLAAVEHLDNIFVDLDCGAFSGVPAAAR